jgi:hypothetical protein
MGLNRRNLIVKLIGAVAVLFGIKIATKPAWKYLAVCTRDIPDHLAFDAGMEHILQDLTAAANAAIMKARTSGEPLARMEFAWRRIRTGNRESCFARMIAVNGDSTLGALEQTQRGMV